MLWLIQKYLMWRFNKRQPWEQYAHYSIYNLLEAANRVAKYRQRLKQANAERRDDD